MQKRSIHEYKTQSLKRWTLILVLLLMVTVCENIQSTDAIVIAQSPQQSQAQTVVQCTGTTSLTYSPGLTNTRQTVVITTNEALSHCLHIPDLPALPFLMPATSQTQLTRDNRTCTTLLAGGPGSQVLTWNNGETSTVNYVSTTNIVNGNIVSVQTGTITMGRYAGQSIIGTRIWTPLLGGQPIDFVTGCSSPGGITSLTGTLTFDIL
jgi:hypothetical protein